MKIKLTIILLLSLAAKGSCGNFTPQEQALIAQGLVVEVRQLNRHSGHEIEIIHGPKGSGPVEALIFGMEDISAARKAGLEMSQKGYVPDEAVKHLLQQAQARYGKHNVFVKWYMDEAANSYNATK
jgi:hypothetical protein